ncbi:hypothetical protein F53441_7501 [Fusarium austroafricanum]|uniref:Uncharacterized protein n=1 Tax=Fusarium austroafricanum TaxID=2364996 RepID=A0A8H4P5S2_9HYPO|nr:hypothetical protein F53441_7501 [Fusarium austroafricanum]
MFHSMAQFVSRTLKIDGYNRTGHEKLEEADGLANAFAYWAGDENNMRIFYIWEKELESKKEVGITMQTSKFVLCDGPLSIKVNQHPALCMIWVFYSSEHGPMVWAKQWYYDDCSFEVYDLYGNYGEFSVTFRLDKIIINDSNKHRN